MSENETRPGGVYLVNGRWLDANGKPTDPPESLTKKAEQEEAKEEEEIAVNTPATRATKRG